MFSIFVLLLLTGYLTYQSMQVSKRRAAEAEHRREEDDKMPKVAVNRDFIERIEQGAAPGTSDVAGIAKILHQWNPKPRGEEVEVGEYSDLAEALVAQLRRDVNAEKVSDELSRSFLRKYGHKPEHPQGIANYIVNWWRAYIVS